MPWGLTAHGSGCRSSFDCFLGERVVRFARRKRRIAAILLFVCGLCAWRSYLLRWRLGHNWLSFFGRRFFGSLFGQRSVRSGRSGGRRLRIGCLGIGARAGRLLVAGGGWDGFLFPIGRRLSLARNER